MYKLKPKQKREKLVIPGEQLLDEAENAGKRGKSRKCEIEKNATSFQNEQFGIFLAAAIRIFELTIF